MKKLLFVIVAAIGISISLVSLPHNDVSAQTSGSGGQALEISPPVVTLSVNPGETITTQIKLRDISSGKLVVSSQINDFVADGEDGTPKILLEDDESNPYSLKTWISPIPTLTLNPKQIKDLPVTIRVPNNAAPGGYYAVIRFTATPPELEGTGVSLSASLGALLLVRVKGDVEQKLAIEQFAIMKDGKPSTFLESTPIQFMERLKNTGNIHEQPAGQVTITDMFGKKVATLNINLPPRIVLPQSIRKFEQSLDSTVLGNKILFGRYTAELNVTYGATGQTEKSTLSFWVIPYRLILTVIGLVIGGFIALRIFVKRYNSHIISKAQKPRRK